MRLDGTLNLFGRASYPHFILLIATFLLFNQSNSFDNLYEMIKGRKRIHNHLRKYRKMMGYTLKEVAWLLGLKSTNRLSRWEQGRSMPSVKNLQMLGIIYRTLIDQLYPDQRAKLRTMITEREQILEKKKKSNVEI